MYQIQTFDLRLDAEVSKKHTHFFAVFISNDVYVCLQVNLLAIKCICDHQIADLITAVSALHNHCRPLANVQKFPLSTNFVP